MHKKTVMCGEFAEILEAFNFNIKTINVKLNLYLISTLFLAHLTIPSQLLQAFRLDPI